MNYSTGALAIQLPIDIVTSGIEKACDELSKDGGFDAAEAILTTDKKTKTIAIEAYIQGKKIMIAGMVKGSTMIHPNMGTMLGFIVTDVNISKILLHKALKESVDVSFNMISIDGDTSTNDMVIVMANGAADHPIINSVNEDYEIFSRALNFVNTELAKMIAKDGEGATKFIEVEVINAKDLQDARFGARAIVSSNLIKCEVFGSVAKWSTIACVLGYSDINMKPEDFDIFISNDEVKVQIVKGAKEINQDKGLVKEIMSGDYVRILVDLKNGKSHAVAFGCDLTNEYVMANGYFL
jgi:glutamate N-acetyltransferase/amino-acid N-acetyltransferase